MKRIAAGLLGLMLVGCQQLDMPTDFLVTPGPVPELRASALGEKLVLNGTVENWPAGMVADVVLNWSSAGQPNVAGTVTSDGSLALSTLLTPSWMQGAVEALFGPGAPNVTDKCSSTNLTVSNADAMGLGYSRLPLIRKSESPQNLRPQLSPALPSPELVRRDGHKELQLFYVDRDLRLVGTQLCAGRTWADLGKWQQATSVNLQLRKGWNIMTVEREYLGMNESEGISTYLSRLSIQGGDMLAGSAWAYNDVPLR